MLLQVKNIKATIGILHVDKNKRIPRIFSNLFIFVDAMYGFVSRFHLKYKWIYA